MKVDLEKVDKLRERVDLTYEEAASYLEATGGDLVRALVMAERDYGASNGHGCPRSRSTSGGAEGSDTSGARSYGPEVVWESAPGADWESGHDGDPQAEEAEAGWVQRVGDLVRRGSSARLVVERDGTVFANLPVAAGVVGAIWAPELAAVSAIAALVSHCSLRIEQGHDIGADEPHSGGEA